MRILLIEDDHEAAVYLVKGLTESGHRVDLAEAGRTGLERARSERFDAMIIDRMLPEIDGLSIVAALRAARDQTPVLVLSALGDVEDRVVGLACGLRRLSAQTVRVLRAVGADRGADPARDRRDPA